MNEVKINIKKSLNKVQTQIKLHYVRWKWKSAWLWEANSKIKWKVWNGDKFLTRK